MVSQRSVDSVKMGAFRLFNFVCLRRKERLMRRSVTTPYPLGYVLAAGRLRPRGKPERKRYYMEIVPCKVGKIKQIRRFSPFVRKAALISVLQLHLGSTASIVILFATILPQSGEAQED